jgi:hypothetical protein
MKQINKLRSILAGNTPIYEANDGMSVEEVVIRYDNYFFMIDLDTKTGKPTGDFSWSEGMPATDVPVRDYYHAVKNEESK